MSTDLEIPKEKRIVMVILAAGKSSRMKDIKQLLPWKDNTLLSNAIDIGLKSNVDSVLVVLGASSEKIRPSIEHLEIDVIENKKWEYGLGSSISCAIQHLEKSDVQVDGVLICLADMPFIEVSHLNKMIASYMTNDRLIIATKLKAKAIVPALFDGFYFKELIVKDRSYSSSQIFMGFAEFFQINYDQLYNEIGVMDKENLLK